MARLVRPRAKIKTVGLGLAYDGFIYLTIIIRLLKNQQVDRTQLIVTDKLKTR
jgi:hypothetical protein